MEGRCATRQLKYVLVLQGHANHRGGVADLQEKYGARMAMAECDWKIALRSRRIDSLD
jgi:hypothetical protein